MKFASHSILVECNINNNNTKSLQGPLRPFSITPQWPYLYKHTHMAFLRLTAHRKETSSVNNGFRLHRNTQWHTAHTIRTIAFYGIVPFRAWHTVHGHYELSKIGKQLCEDSSKFFSIPLTWMVGVTCQLMTILTFGWNMPGIIKIYNIIRIIIYLENV